MSRFVFVICQYGAESACKVEIARNHPNLSLAFSRPGFITFKVAENSLSEKFYLRSTLARSFGWSTGHAKRDSVAELIQTWHARPELGQVQNLHIWQRDAAVPGTRGFEPGPNELVQLVSEQIDKYRSRHSTNPIEDAELKINRRAPPDDRVLDVILVEPNDWWFGYHYAIAPALRWPGGVPFVKSSGEVINRAYFKVQEALLWSGIHIQPGDWCAEIGAAPGGACQFLLEKGARVIAVDPAEMDPAIASHPHLHHFRRRSKEMKKRDFREIRWLLADLNVAPNYTLDSVDEIVSSRHLRHLKGMILTLKLPDWKLGTDISKMVERVRSFGFRLVKTRQLAFNRQEFCLIAVRDRHALRSSRQR